MSPIIGPHTPENLERAHARMRWAGWANAGLLFPPLGLVLLATWVARRLARLWWPRT